ncbi:hypothetical protein ACIA03_23440 [Nocardioides sp. NPDC051685]|uniref:hypothetical protein n=1 Tax=Nocardioides sp. NPDC051685 TaxID=3364334 RepID=UPI00378BFA26
MLSKLASGRRRWTLIALLLIVMMGVQPAARTASKPSESDQTDTAATTASTVADGMDVHQDRQLGVKFNYPKTWRVAHSRADLVVLEAGRADDLVLIRKTILRAKVNATNVADFRTVTDGIFGDPKANLDVLDTGSVQIGDLPGVFYLYTFPFESGRGMQAQYFVFEGRNLYTLVFQTRRAKRFASLAPSFDVVLKTFRPTGTLEPPKESRSK